MLEREIEACLLTEVRVPETNRFRAAYEAINAGLYTHYEVSLFLDSIHLFTIFI